MAADAKPSYEKPFWQNGKTAMTATQRRRRYIFWRGSFPVLAAFTVLMVSLSLADRITS